MLPGGASVFRFIDSVSVSNASLIVVLSCSHPDYVWITGIHGDAANGVRSLMVENRSEGRAGIDGFPDSA